MVDTEGLSDEVLWPRRYPTIEDWGEAKYIAASVLQSRGLWQPVPIRWVEHSAVPVATPAAQAQHMRAYMDDKYRTANAFYYKENDVNNREVLEAEAARVNKQLAALDALAQKYGEDDFEDGTVLKFRYRFNGAARATKYRYAIIKANGLWYSTGPKTERGYTWDEMIAFWERGIMTGLKQAITWEDVFDGSKTSA